MENGEWIGVKVLKLRRIEALSPLPCGERPGERFLINQKNNAHLLLHEKYVLLLGRNTYTIMSLDYRKYSSEPFPVRQESSRVNSIYVNGGGGAN
ncbi:MAG: hypothetical protein LBR86_01435 [Tannerella sp.]|jgi:hypothetical protein|nr:hypothetical protein [Tannerella sp.]